MIKKINEITENATYEKEIFAVDVDGNITEVVIRKETFTIAEKESRIANFQKRLDALQADIDAVNVIESE